jgi:hypothetical protein
LAEAVPIFISSFGIGDASSGAAASVADAGASAAAAASVACAAFESAGSAGAFCAQLMTDIISRPTNRKRLRVLLLIMDTTIPLETVQG